MKNHKRHFVLIIILLSVFFLSFGNSDTINVPNDYQTIQSAVDVALEGDTIIVAAGTYFENISFNKSLYLLGEDPKTTIIDAQDSAKCISFINWDGSYGKISGFTIQNSGTGYTDGSGNCGLQLHTNGTGDWDVTNNIFLNNPQSAIVTTDTGTISRNIFDNNYGGIFISENGNVNIVNNNFRGNTRAVETHSQATNAIIENNIISDNGLGIIIDNTSYTIRYNDLWSNGTHYIGCEEGIGDIESDPQFIGGSPFDYHLKDISPCIDTGNPDSPLDPDSTRADIGVYYFDQALNTTDENMIPQSFSLHQNFPNPFNPLTTIKYEIPEQSAVTILVYNILGKVIKQLENSVLEAGLYDTRWDGTDEMGNIVSAGVYVYRIQAGSYTQTKKMIYLK
ncbi:MAG: right-handed parallel beta-helix repeat-containing protein [Candidatus Neomarinimicrobiota bacterium]